MRPSLATACAACAAAVLALSTSQVAAEPVYGLLSLSQTNGSAQYLDRFDTATPGTAQTFASNASQLLLLQGTVSGQTIRAIDFRPSNGVLYAVSSSNAMAQLYTVNLTTGVLTVVGGGFALTGNTSSEVSIDFNPVVDRVRVVTGSGQNVRVNPDTGALTAPDTAINGVGNPSIAAVAYTNNFAGATSTTLYAYDFNNDQLDTIGSVNGSPTSPNSGTTFVVGNTGLLSVSSNIGLDIDAAGLAFASVYDDAFGNFGFYSVNLMTGRFTLIGAEAFALIDFAVQSTPRATAVPEPDALALVALALAGMVLTSRRRAHRATL